MLLDTVAYLTKLNPSSLTGLLIVFLLPFLLTSFRKSPFPLINGRKPFEFNYTKARLRFLKDARTMLDVGLSKANVFRIVSDNGVHFGLSPKYANEIRSHHALSFGASLANDFHTNIRGFEPFLSGTTGDEIIQDAVRMKLTQSLGSVTEPLSNETSLVLEEIWTDNAEWHDISLKTTILKIVAQLSSRVFLGDKICRNPNWLRITVDYTVDSFLAAEDLRLWPKLLRPVVANFLPRCQRIRKQIDETRRIINPVLEERRAAKDAAIRDGKTPERYTDAMEWMEECAKSRPYDAAMGQLSFSVAAIHTTSDLLTQVLLDICGRDDLIQELRQEAVSVIKEEGFKKTTLYKLKLMDSVVKESQRLKPIAIGAMRRLVEEQLKLSDGTTIPKGATIFVPSSKMWDPAVYPDPATFDPYRFLKLRKIPGHETSSQLVSPSPEHLGFGLGKHACPGRFFAANEVKIALCHILLKYEFRLAEGYTPTVRKRGLGMNADPFARISIRRREEELRL